MHTSSSCGCNAGLLPRLTQASVTVIKGFHDVCHCMPTHLVPFELTVANTVGPGQPVGTLKGSIPDQYKIRPA